MEELVQKPKDLYETPGLMHLQDWDYLRMNIQNEKFGSIVSNPANK